MANRFWVGGTSTWDATAGTKWATISGGAGGAAVPTAADDVFFDGASGVGTVTISATANCKSLTTTGFGGTITGASALNVALSFDITGGTWSYSGALTFNGTAAGNTITTAGKTINGTTTFNGVGGGWTFAGSFTSASTITLTNGSLSTGGNNVQATAIASSNTNARALDVSGSTLTLTGTGNVWNINTSTGMALTATTSTIRVTNATATSKAVLGGNLAYGSLQFVGAGSGALTVTGVASWAGTMAVANTGGATFSYTAVTVNAVDFTGFTGTFAGNQGTTWTGSTWIWSGAMTDSYTGTITCDAGTVQTITSSGHIWKQPFVISKTGGSVSLVDAFVSTATFAVSLGTFTTAGQNLTCTRFIGTGVGVRSITIDNSVITCTGSTTANAWDCTTTTNLTFSATGSEIKLTGQTGTSVVHFACDTLAYHYVTLVGAATIAGAGGYVIDAGSSSYDKIEYTGPGRQALFSTGTQTINPGGRLVLQGDGTALWTFTASAGTAAWSKTNGIMNEMDYLQTTSLFAVGGALWFLGNHSTVDATCKGWYATAAGG